MTVIPQIPELEHVNRLATESSLLGFEIVDLAGFLDLVEAQATEQRNALEALTSSAAQLDASNTGVRTAADTLTTTTREASQEVSTSVDTIRELGTQTTTVATWVQELERRTEAISDTLSDVKTNNSKIASIAMQVNTLAINAKIEAARAGESGRGFAVVADAINELSQKTRDAATQITDNIETLAGWIAELKTESKGVAQTATDVITLSDDSNRALNQIESSVQSAFDQAETISTQTEVAARAMQSFNPNLTGIDTAVRNTTTGIKSTHERISRLIDTSESIVQSSAALGGTTKDAPFIAYVRDAAATASHRLEEAIASGKLSQAQMFDKTYRKVPGTNPQQVVTAFTELMDQVMPEIQEAALGFDPKVVFCAAVDTNGYLPTHNLKFSHPQGPDPVWNMANCRNRRIFDDRVGLKAGRSTAPFLLQVYRRDMGGGTFTMMKDLSAPIVIDGRHWGGLRFAYTF